MLNVQMKPITLNVRLWIYIIKDIFLKDSIDTEYNVSGIVFLKSSTVFNTFTVSMHFKFQSCFELPVF